jgi:hypothetical protein
VEAKVQHGEDGWGIPIFFVVARIGAIVLIAAFVIARCLVAIGIEEAKSLWPRRRVSRTE